MRKIYGILLLLLIAGLFTPAFTQDTLQNTVKDTLNTVVTATPAVQDPPPAPHHHISEDPALSLSSVLRGLLGIVVLLGISLLASTNRKAIRWKQIGIALALQFLIAVLVLKVPQVQFIFEIVGKFFVKILSFTDAGSEFLFKAFGSNQMEWQLLNFAFKILPVIIFFSALTSLLFYLGILQKIVWLFAWVMKKTMKLSGSESLAAAANIFLGQTEAPLLIKPYISGMTRSEIMCLMTGGMATIAGSVFAAFIGFLGGDDPESQLYFAKHLLTASVMSAPAAIAAAKIILPETESFSTSMDVSKEKIGTNFLEAIANGTSEGIKLAVNVAGMLLVFIAMVAMLNFFFYKIGDITGLNGEIAELSEGRYDKFSFEFILGYLCAPFCWLLGVPSEDIFVVGQLLGQKTVLNEFYAYGTMGEYIKEGGKFVHMKSVIMVTYMLCGFANFASIGIQIGGIGALAPDKKSVLSQLGFRALIGGTVASLFTAVIIGMFY
jgi:CNT family concentrative nucleoside transporter